MRWVGKTYGLGLVVCIIVGVFGLIASWVLGAARAVQIDFFENRGLNLAATLAILLAVPLAVGLLANVGFFRTLALRFFSVIPIPVVSSLAKFFLRVVYQVKRRDFFDCPEVMFWVGGDRWTYGIITEENLKPENPKDPESPLVEWCEILGPPTPPL